MWSAIRPYEFLNLAWTKKDKAQKATHVLAMIERFNYVSGWVATTICLAEKQKDRIKVVTKWIEVAQKLHAMHNFNGLLEIVSGLNRGPVYRLKQTFTTIEGKDTKLFKAFQDLLGATSSDKSYSSVRKLLKSVNPPCIPYLGMYLTDLTFIEEGNKDFLSKNNTLINFHKRRLTANVIADVQTYQNSGYNFIEVPEITTKLFNEAILDESELYDISNYLEPRPGQVRGERPAILAQVAQGGVPLVKKKEDGKLSEYLEFKKEWQPYIVPDGPSNIVTNASGMITGLTFHKIIEKLTHHVTPDTNLGPLLATLESWTTPDQFLDALLIRFDVPDPKDKSEENMSKYRDEFQGLIRRRVVNVLKSWISNHWYHFAENEELREKLMGFINGKLNSVLPTLAAPLNSAVAKQVNAFSGLPKSPEPVPEPILPQNGHLNAENAQLLDLDPLEIARQLSILNSETFCKIKPAEMLSTRDTDRPNLKAMDDSLVSIQAWVLEELGNYQKSGQIHLALDALAHVACHCSTLKNWHAACAIINAFNAMYNVIKPEWGKVTSLARKFYFDYREIFLPSSKKDLSDLLKNLHTPCVPITGPYLGAIDVIQKTIPADMITPEIINIEKKKKLGDIIVKLQQLQKMTYNFIPVSLIQGYLIRPREISHLVSGLGASSNKGAKSSLLDIILSDSEFKSEIQEMVKEVLEEEIAKLRAEVFNMVITGAITIGTPHPTAELITDVKARDAIVRAFPNCSFSTWSHHDTAGVLSPVPTHVTLNVIQWEDESSSGTTTTTTTTTATTTTTTTTGTTNSNARVLLDVKEKVVLGDIALMLKIGQLYKSLHPQFVPLSSVLVVNSISEQALTVAERCKIRIIKI
eukprot:TRINITY_DN7227_c0_g1_i2.p1 TRINITY_DN7227_c0_g1~~TRINITY_DN7227_c0_g1_i2.p1  ORF type:complete len:865 (+),score=209.08 TRINITY_DN7227_c0_g1_i2:826-3420(+)